MRSGPSVFFVEQRSDGWYVVERAITWQMSQGPFRFRWLALLVKWANEDAS